MNDVAIEKKTEERLVTDLISLVHGYEPADPNPPPQQRIKANCLHNPELRALTGTVLFAIGRITSKLANLNNSHGADVQFTQIEMGLMLLMFSHYYKEEGVNAQLRKDVLAWLGKAGGPGNGPPGGSNPNPPG